MNTTPGPDVTLDRLFPLVGGGVLVLIGLLLLVQVGTTLWRPARIYEATATFALYPNGRFADAQDGLQFVWNLLPPTAAVGLEPEPGHPDFYRLSFRSSDAAQSAKQANAVAAAVQANADRAGAGRFQLLHPADVPVAWTSPRNGQLRSGALLLLPALLPIGAGLWLVRRRRTAPLFRSQAVLGNANV